MSEAKLLIDIEQQTERKLCFTARLGSENFNEISITCFFFSVHRFEFIQISCYMILPKL